MGIKKAIKKVVEAVQKDTRNRKQRRADAAWERHRPMRERKYAAKVAHEEQKKVIAARVKRKQDLAHARAIIRKEAAKPGSQEPINLKAAKKLVAKAEAARASRPPFISKRSIKRGLVNA